MKAVKLSQVKDDLSKYVALAQRGERVRILVRGVPAADLVPISPGMETTSDEKALLTDLERRGVLRRGQGGVPSDLMKPGPRVRGVPMSKTLVDDRRDR